MEGKLIKKNKTTTKKKKNPKNNLKKQLKEKKSTQGEGSSTLGTQQYSINVGSWRSLSLNAESSALKMLREHLLFLFLERYMVN